MSLYNLVHGMNANALVVLSAIVGYRIDEEFPRFRNVFTEAEDAPSHLKGADLYVYTRMGGGNSDCWGPDNQMEAPVEGQFDCLCPACKCDAIEQRDYCIGSYDDDYDSTYRTFAIRLTDEQRAELEEVKKNGPSEALMERILALHPNLKAKVDAAKEAAKHE